VVPHAKDLHPLAEVHHRSNVDEPTVTENKDSDGRQKTMFSFRLKRICHYPEPSTVAKMGYGLFGRKQRVKHNRLHRFCPKTFSEDPLLTKYQDDNEKAAVTAMKQAVQDPDYTGICFLYGIMSRCKMDNRTSRDGSWLVFEHVALVYDGNAKNFMIMTLKGPLKLDSISDCRIIRALFPDANFSMPEEWMWNDLMNASEDLYYDDDDLFSDDDEVRRRLPSSASTSQPVHVTTSPAAIIFMTLALGMLLFLLSRRWQERLRQTPKPSASETDGAKPACDMV